MKSKPIVVRSGKLPPQGRQAADGKLAAIRGLLLKLKRPDDYADCELDHATCTALYRAAAQLKLKITTRKMASGKRRVWRVWR